MARTIEPAAKLLMISAAFGRIGMYGLPTQSLTRPPRSSDDEASSADARGHVVISLRVAKGSGKLLFSLAFAFLR